MQTSEMAIPSELPRLVAPPVVPRAFRDEARPLTQVASKDPSVPLITSVPTTDEPEEAQAFIERQHARRTSGAGHWFAIAGTWTDEAMGTSSRAHGTARHGWDNQDRP